MSLYQVWDIYFQNWNNGRNLKLWQKSMKIQNILGSFNNHVDKILSIFDHPPPPVDALKILPPTQLHLNIGNFICYPMLSGETKLGGKIWSKHKILMYLITAIFYLFCPRGHLWDYLPTSHGQSWTFNQPPTHLILSTWLLNDPLL